MANDGGNCCCAFPFLNSPKFIALDWRFDENDRLEMGSLAHALFAISSLMIMSGIIRYQVMMQSLPFDYRDPRFRNAWRPSQYSIQKRSICMSGNGIARASTFPFIAHAFFSARGEEKNCFDYTIIRVACSTVFIQELAIT